MDTRIDCRARRIALVTWRFTSEKIDTKLIVELVAPGLKVLAHTRLLIRHLIAHFCTSELTNLQGKPGAVSLNGGDYFDSHESQVLTQQLEMPL
jgi:hypothetical protein